MTNQIIINPDGSRSQTICEDCPNGYPPAYPVNPTAPQSGSPSNAWIFGLIVGVIALLALIIGLVDRKPNPPIPSVEREQPPLTRDSGAPVS